MKSERMANCSDCRFLTRIKRGMTVLSWMEPVYRCHKLDVTQAIQIGDDGRWVECSYFQPRSIYRWLRWRARKYQPVDIGPRLVTADMAKKHLERLAAKKEPMN